MRKLLEIFGWYGTAAVIISYALICFSVLQPISIWYQMLNLTGALGIITISLYKKVYQPAVLNIIWAIISLVAILKSVL